MTTVFQHQNTETPTKRRVRQRLEIVRSYIKEHPRATVREVGRVLGVASTSHVHRMLKQIRAELCVCPTCGGKGSIRTSASEAGPGRVPLSEAEKLLVTVQPPTRNAD